jgi:hypothetical protein
MQLAVALLSTYLLHFLNLFSTNTQKNNFNEVSSAMYSQGFGCVIYI